MFREFLRKRTERKLEKAEATIKQLKEELAKVTHEHGRQLHIVSVRDRIIAKKEEKINVLNGMLKSASAYIVALVILNGGEEARNENGVSFNIQKNDLTLALDYDVYWAEDEAKKNIIISIKPKTKE